jgi:hypothetical protein
MKERKVFMETLAVMILAVVVWFVVQAWLLPRLGIST